MLSHIRSDIAIIRERDPAARGWLEIFICYPGFQALMMHRLCHTLWRSHLPLKLIARSISHVGRIVTGIEIHPGAKIGRGVFIDHGMGVVIGETARIGDKCLLYQGVTLGGTGKEIGKRHPFEKCGRSRCKVCNINIGTNTRIGAGSVVVKNVESNCTVVGIPGRVVHRSGVKIAPLAHSALPDAEAEVIRNLMDRIDQLEMQVRCLEEGKKDKETNLIENSSKKEVRKAQSLKDKQIIEFIGDNI